MHLQFPALVKFELPPEREVDFGLARENRRPKESNADEWAPAKDPRIHKVVKLFAGAENSQRVGKFQLMFKQCCGMLAAGGKQEFHGHARFYALTAAGWLWTWGWFDIWTHSSRCV